MDTSTFRAALIAYIRSQAKPPDKFSHQPRLYELARQVAQGCTYDDDVLFAAAWLHDLGVFVGHRPEDLAALAAWDNVAYAVEKAPELLRRFGFPAEKIPAVIECIRTHLPSRKPESFEATALRDADILEQLGGIGILRAVSKVGRDTRYPRFIDALHVLRANLEKLPSQLHLDSARELAEPRLKMLHNFLQAIESEAGLKQSSHPPEDLL
jgi:uncharacterized protein